MKQIFYLVHNTARSLAADMAYKAPEGTVCEFKDATRTSMQNRVMWPILDAFSRQKQWLVNDNLRWLTSEQWKDLLTASFRRETIQMAQGIDGGLVALGVRTSTMGKKEFSDFIEYLKATASELGIELDYEE